MKKKKLKVVHEFDPSIPNWQERLDCAFDLVFRKIAEMEQRKYGTIITTE